MASGSSAGRAINSGSQGGFDFASDDILCTYEDYDNHQGSFTGGRSDAVSGTNPSKDFHTTRVSRSSAFPTSNIYAQPEDSLNLEVITIIERTMKKYADNQMRFLEGLSSRLSQLELYCYNLDKSIGEMRSDLVLHNEEAGTKLKSMDKHLQEVHRSVQILRDKQELADTQKELKLQFAQKEASHSQEEEKSSSTPASETKNTEDGTEMHNQQLALALPHQLAPQPAPPSTTAEQRQQQQQQQPATLTAAASQMPSQPINQQPPYYLPAAQLPNPAAQPQPPQSSYVHADSQYRAPQMVPNPSQGQVNQPPQVQQFPQYQQQWSQPGPHPPAQPQSQTQIRGPQSTLYPAYMHNQPPNPPQQEQMPSSMPMQVPAPGTPQQGVGRVELPFGYGGHGRPLQTQTPPHPIKGGDGYTVPGIPPQVSSGGSYMIYDGEGQSHHPPPTHFSQSGGYPPANAPHHNPHPQPPTSGGHMIRGPSPNPPQFVRNHPYGDLIEKLVSMGYRGDHVASVIQRLEESGQPVDFNAVLDRLNGHSSGGSQRQW